MLLKHILLCICLVTTFQLFAQNKAEKRIRTAYWEPHNDTLVIDRSIVITYNKKGWELQEERYNKQGIRTLSKVNSYDKKGRVIAYMEIPEDSSMLEHITFSYNRFGQKTMEWAQDAQGVTITKTMFTYNAFGLKVREEEYDASGSLFKTTTYAYDRFGDLTERIQYDALGHILAKKTVTGI